MMDAGKIYNEVAIHSSNPISLVLSMYDILLDDLRQAIHAIHAGDIEVRTAKIRHAFEVIQQLQLSLDFKNGGDSANCLDTLYSIVRAKVLQAQFQQSSTILEEQIQRILTVRNAWQELLLRTTAESADCVEAMPLSVTNEEGSTLHWRI